MMATLWTIVGRPPRSRVPIHRIVTALSTACQPGNKRSTRSTFLESHLLHRNVSISQNGRRVAPHISAGRTSARLSVCGASGGRITASTYDATQHEREGHDLLKDRLREAKPSKKEQYVALGRRKNDVLAQATVASLLDGLRDIPLIPHEPSDFSSDKDVAYRGGWSLPRLYENVCRKGHEHVPTVENVLWLFLVGSLPSEAEVKSLKQDLARRFVRLARERRLYDGPQWTPSDGAAVATSRTSPVLERGDQRDNEHDVLREETQHDEDGEDDDDDDADEEGEDESGHAGPLEDLATKPVPDCGSTTANIARRIFEFQGQSAFFRAYQEGVAKDLHWEYIYEDVMDLIAWMPVIVAEACATSKAHRLACQAFMSDDECETQGDALASIFESDWCGRMGQLLQLAGAVSVEEDVEETGNSARSADHVASTMRLFALSYADVGGGHPAGHVCHTIASALSDPYYALGGAFLAQSGPGLADECLDGFAWMMKTIVALRGRAGGYVGPGHVKEVVDECLSFNALLPVPRQRHGARGMRGRYELFQTVQRLAYERQCESKQVTPGAVESEADPHVENMVTCEEGDDAELMEQGTLDIALMLCEHGSELLGGSNAVGEEGTLEALLEYVALYDGGVRDPRVIHAVSAAVGSIGTLSQMVLSRMGGLRISNPDSVSLDVLGDYLEKGEWVLAREPPRSQGAQYVLRNSGMQGSDVAADATGPSLNGGDKFNPPADGDSVDARMDSTGTVGDVPTPRKHEDNDECDDDECDEDDDDDDEHHDDKTKRREHAKTTRRVL